MKSMCAFAHLLAILLLAESAHALECHGAKQSLNRDVFVYLDTAEAIRSKDRSLIRDAATCNWQRWRGRDGAATYELLQDFIVLADAEPRVFIDVALRGGNEFESLLESLPLAFYPKSARDSLRLERLRKRLHQKFSVMSRDAKSAVAKDALKELLLALVKARAAIRNREVK